MEKQHRVLKGAKEEMTARQFKRREELGRLRDVEREREIALKVFEKPFENYYCRNLLNYIHKSKKFKRRYHTSRKTMLQLDIIYSQMKPLVQRLGCIFFSYWPKGFHRTPNVI